jgi:Ca2+-binding RTX toxin-like protein
MAIIRGTRRADRLNGTDQSDFISALDGDDVVFAGKGNDSVDGGAGNDSLNGGDGNDILLGGLGNDLLHGDKGNDVLLGGDGSDAVNGGDGNDLLVDSGIDELNPGLLAVILIALVSTPSISLFNWSIQNIPLIGSVGAGFDIVPDDLNGGNGNDIIVSTGGNDSANGGNGNDTLLLSGPGVKSALGGAGDDVTICIGANNLLAPADWPFADVSGGDGDDTLLTAGLFAGLTFDGGAGNDTMIMHEKMTIADLARAIVGGMNVGDDYHFSGGDGDDTLAGTRLFVGNLSYEGGGGNDRLEFDGFFAGNLSFDGGAGNDTTTFHSRDPLAESGDLVFEPGESGIEYEGGDGGDTLKFTGLLTGKLTFDGGAGDDWFGLSSSVPGDLYVWESSEWGPFAAFLVFFGGAGNDVASIQAEALTIDLPPSETPENNNFESQFFAGDGNDFIEITGAGDLDPRNPVRQNMLVDGGNGDDTITINRLFVGNLSVDGGAGDDKLKQYAALGDSIVTGSAGWTGGAGNDLIEIINPADTPVRQNIVVDGGDGDDTFSLRGFLANQTVSGGDGKDVISIYAQGSFADELLPNSELAYSGGLGNDLIEIIHEIANPGDAPVRPNIVAEGGDGDDRFVFGVLVLDGIAPGFVFKGFDLWNGNRGSDRSDPIDFGGLNPFVRATWQTGGADDDFLTGGSANDLLFGNEDNDMLAGGRGNDQVVGGTGDDRAEGGEGDDILVDWEATIEVHTSGRRPAVIITADLGARPTADTDTLLGGLDNDVLVSLIGDDRVEGGDGHDLIVAFAPNIGPVEWSTDDIDSGLPDVRINATGAAVDAGAETVAHGGAGNDHILSNFGNALFGDEGDDTIHITASGATPARPTTVDGGTGDDAIRVEMPPPGPVATPVPEVAVLAGDGNDVIDITGGGSRSEPERQTVIVDGGTGDDVVNAAGYDVAAAAIGVFINGSGGADTLTGTNGKDGFNGGPGPDTLTGGTGDDIFEFDEPGDGPDLITDFVAGSDTFHIDLAGFGGGLAPGALTPDRFISSADPIPVTMGDGVFLYDTDNGALAWDGDGADGNAPVSLAFLTNLPALSASDFLIV